MHDEAVIDELLDKACASIQYRLRRDILCQPTSDSDMRLLHEQLYHDSAVQTVIGWQQPDGWLAWRFHGTPGTETGVRLLCEKGLDTGDAVVSDALDALEAHTDRLHRGIGKVGTVLDERRLGGSEMIRAVVFAYAGVEDKPFVQDRIVDALAGFRALLALESLDEIYDEHDGKRAIKPGALFPSIYHLRLLAFTKGWRTPENRAMMSAAVTRLIDLSPIPALRVLHGSQWIAPASFCMDNFDPDMAVLTPAGWMRWFHRTELLARLGVVSAIPELQRQVDRLRDMMILSDGRFMYPLTHSYFRRWNAYTGLMLERDWRTIERRLYDLTFRSLFILHLAETSGGTSS